ncbi:alpha/beta fold hydrolase [Streptomyces sp. B6B3]|uniref:alpha/beta fold hydrolase n=1 Tax=Streptomyces sp. B6B3 TaxID=3153570 RepID=UPI00325E25F4
MVIHRSTARRAATRTRTMVVALAAVVGTVAVPAGAAGQGQSGLERYHQQDVDWGGGALGPDDELGRELDAAGVECADVTVPLDYADPGGRTLTVAISRIPATDAEHRIGPLLLNGGGPGGTGIDMPPDIREAMGELSARYDIIGMDPRFVGRSTPLDCGWSTGTFTRAPGDTRAEFRDAVAFQRDLAERCRRAEGDVLPHATTRNTARDMDVIRGALDEEAISYLGYSYGSYLGEVYAELFPGRTDRMVLDGVIDPRVYQPRMLRGAEAANEAALRDWAAWAAEHHDAHGLGATPEAVWATVERVFDVAADRPLRVAGYEVDESVLPIVLFSNLGADHPDRYADLAGVVGTLARAANGEPVEPTPPLAETLDFLLTGAASAQASMQTAILCGDVSASRQPAEYWTDVQRSRAEHPLAGPLMNNITPCSFWDRPVEPPTVVEGDQEALLVAATGDPRTVYERTLDMREDLWPSARLVTLDGAHQHGVYGEYGSACADGLVNAYLRTGQLPERDATCPA